MSNYEGRLLEAKNKIKELYEEYPEFLFVIVERRGLDDNPYNLMKDILSYLEWEYNKE